MVAADDGAVTLDENESTVGISCEQASQVNVGCSGTFGGGTATIEISLDHGATWVSSGITMTAPGSKVLTAPATQVRVTLSGATAPSVKCACGIQYDE